ncbi:hypothetical protein A3C18_03710 [Candidatus Kaiserbacteria bacterium RIFCSPHIGHO2_02_FULL_54_11b]|uniref:Uncharacterized protein n=2 Tax=Candidatus Kaiseribacteriota TaxID=1752734 RepID=A0A1F6CPG0_9BACT|nr:MAG: hypothetical protein A2704_02825 [Candidatus Kaiserbacteria bacterium RIFCSPHIGHO2_01_FULL_54_36b]OGG64245.1 MAG: hypothetical protein A3C18_03710 [Candidatus Kaiserbacteria bacterium RIFCSPHIGHO2_02_FULL_54_11b]
MADMQFQTDNQNEFGRPPASQGFDLTGMLMKWGVASSRQQAEYVLIGIAVLAIVVGVFFYLSGSSGSPIPSADPDGPAPIVLR